MGRLGASQKKKKPPFDLPGWESLHQDLQGIEAAQRRLLARLLEQRAGLSRTDNQ